MVLAWTSCSSCSSSLLICSFNCFTSLDLSNMFDFTYTNRIIGDHLCHFTRVTINKIGRPMCLNVLCTLEWSHTCSKDSCRLSFLLVNLLNSSSTSVIMFLRGFCGAKEILTLNQHTTKTPNPCIPYLKILNTDEKSSAPESVLCTPSWLLCRIPEGF